ncbi:MAG: 4'-phosphopantetheinyl transferase family protein [Acidimicrobiales bacterium]
MTRPGSARYGILPSLIRDIAGGVICSSESFGDRANLGLFPEEEQTLTRATVDRLREFRTARRCAREALDRLGVMPAAIPVAASRAPVWPPGVLGSITHCRGYRAAAVTREADFSAIGIDAEENLPLPAGVDSVVFSSAERAGLATLSGPQAWDRLLFSAKESLYKAWFQMTGSPLPYSEVAVRLSSQGSFTVDLFEEARRTVGHEMVGRWTAKRGLLITLVVIPSNLSVLVEI